MVGQGDGELARGARRTTTQGELTRQRTLDIAGQLFGEVGYAETKLEDIAAQVGVTKGAILRHFGSKEQLFVAAYKHVMTVNPSWLDVPADVLEGG
ncbi:MAG: TetR family transcriptional regulator, partial [Candidatus Nanopelagicales bacterium]